MATNYPVTINVPQGSVYTAAGDQSIGTSGCGPCVGLIVVDLDGNKTCAHFDCTIVKTAAQATVVQQEVNSVLTAHFPPVTVVQSIGICTTAEKEPSTSAILQGIAAIYGGQVLQQVRPTDGLVVNKAGVIKALEWNDSISTEKSAENGFASINAG